MSGVLATFQGLLQQAYWRGVPFLVDREQTEKGRKIASHDYPFRDGGWVEDLGRKQRVFRMSGHMVGDLAPVMQLLLDAACELPGPGLLIHPTLGAMQVALLSASTSVRKESLRVIWVEFVFQEQGSSLYPSILTNTLTSIISAVSNALLSFGSEIAIGLAALTAVSGILSAVGAGGVSQTFAGAATTAAQDPGALVGMATALPPPDNNTWYGRYANGTASQQLPLGTTVATLQAQLATQRATVAAAGTALVAAANSLSASTVPQLVSAVAALTEAVRATGSNPADQIRVLTPLATLAPPTAPEPPAGSTDPAAAIRYSVAAMARRCALTSIALGSSSYLPWSYDDAVTLRTSLAAMFDVEITAAGDAGDDASYVSLKALRASVIQDLTARAASLPLVMTVNIPTNLPTLTVAYRLYQDASRADQIATETDVVHPAFLPTTMQVLAS